MLLAARCMRYGRSRSNHWPAFPPGRQLGGRIGHADRRLGSGKISRASTARSGRFDTPRARARVTVHRLHFLRRRGYSTINL